MTWVVSCPPSDGGRRPVTAPSGLHVDVHCEWQTDDLGMHDGCRQYVTLRCPSRFRGHHVIRITSA